MAIEEEDLFGALPFGYFGAEIAETLAVTPLFVAAKNGHTEARLKIFEGLGLRELRERAALKTFHDNSNQISSHTSDDSE